MESRRSLFEPGTVIVDRYEVVEVLGRGGMGEVLLASDRLLDGERVALKVLFPHLATRKNYLARFRNEILLSRRLSHPNIVSIYDFGEAGQNHYYICMEFIEGVSLGSLIDKQGSNPLTFNESLILLYQICSALHYAHQFNVIHRDLKPDNILVKNRKSIKLTDFGIARSIEVDQGLTATDEMVGSPYYMAPEQFKAKKPDHRVDIYAFGVLAYQMVTGQRPFEGDTYVSLMGSHLTKDLPGIKAADAPAWFHDFTLTCAEKNPDNRFQNMSEVAEELIERMLQRGISPQDFGESLWPKSCLRQKRKGGFLGFLGF